MPWPLSNTVTVTRSVFQIKSTPMVQPSLVYLMALSNRITISCSMRSGLVTTRGQSSMASAQVKLRFFSRAMFA